MQSRSSKKSSGDSFSDPPVLLACLLFPPFLIICDLAGPIYSVQSDTRFVKIFREPSRCFFSSKSPSSIQCIYAEFGGKIRMSTAHIARTCSILVFQTLHANWLMCNVSEFQMCFRLCIPKCYVLVSGCVVCTGALKWSLWVWPPCWM